MEKITITRALAELKLLDKKIKKRVDLRSNNTLVPVGLYQNRNKKIIGTNQTIEEFEKNTRANYQSIKDLISRRNAIKIAIIESNSKTEVTINGSVFTVAGAIERKNSIEYDKSLLKTLSTQYNDSLERQESHNIDMNEKIDKMIEANLGSDKKRDSTEYKLIAEPYQDANEMKICDPLNVSKEIEDLDEEIEGFLNEVDFVLSESNSQTYIEV
jgi:hypothetical protein